MAANRFVAPDVRRWPAHWLCPTDDDLAVAADGYRHGAVPPRHIACGEINSQVGDIPGAPDRVDHHCRGRSDAATDRLDGLSVTLGRTWFNLRRPTPNRCCGSTSKHPTPLV